MKNKFLFFTIAVISFWIIQCSDLQDSQGTSTGNPMVNFAITGSAKQSVVASLNKFHDVVLNFFFPKAVAMPPPQGLLDRVGNQVNLQSAWIVVKEIEFKQLETADENEVDGDEISFDGPYVIDLFDSNPVNIGTTFLNSENLRRVKMKLENQAQLPQDAPANLINQSILVSGAVNNHLFEFHSDDGVEIEISGSRALGNLNQAQLLVVFRFSDVIKSIDLTQISNGDIISAQNRIPGSQLCPLIDSSAQDLYTCFRKGILYYGNFGKDNGDLDLDENDESVK